MEDFRTFSFGDPRFMERSFISALLTAPIIGWILSPSITGFILMMLFIPSLCYLTTLTVTWALDRVLYKFSGKVDRLTWKTSLLLSVTLTPITGIAYYWWMRRRNLITHTHAV